MPRINWKYVSFLTVLLALYFVLLYFLPHKFNWMVTLYHKDKNPFGAYIFKTLADNSWIPAINMSNQTLFELQDINEPNLLILCQHLEVSESEIGMLLNHAEEGKTILISAHQMDSVLSDSLKLKINQLSLQYFLNQMVWEDSIGFRFVNLPSDSSNIYWMPEQIIPQYFESYDPATTEVLAVDTDDKPLLLKINYGLGNFIVSSTPLVFTNFSMLHNENHEIVAGIMSLLTPGPVFWTEYYQLGRMEASTPLRYILSEPPLKWALYILLLTILMFMFFEMKRKQRIIPVVLPLKNETLDFVKTISRLYYQKKDHKELAMKKMLYFTDYVKQHLHIDTDDEISEVINKIAAKTGSEEREVEVLFNQMNSISTSSYLTPKELKLLIDRIDGIINN